MTRGKLQVELTAKEAEVVLDALALQATMYEQGDMDGMRSPQKLTATLKAIYRAQTAVYDSGFKW